jgi:hypothetical protein
MLVYQLMGIALMKAILRERERRQLQELHLSNQVATILSQGHRP